MKHLFQPQWYGSKYQQQEEDWKIYKFVESKQQTSEQPVDQNGNQKGNQKIS